MSNVRMDALLETPPEQNPNDVVFTPVEWAKDIVAFFQPSGICLDPCRGESAFFDQLPEPKLWCEIAEGVDFFRFHEKVDWIISNPPYSLFSRWLDHSLELADHIVYLIPVNKLLSSLQKLHKVYRFGGIVHIRYYGTGRDAGFPFGFPVGAVYLKRHYTGPMEISWYPAADPG
ncbi:hypothetical protein O9X98_15090 [Agrobacterium salinitolerans]|nr:hypothetical protein [Agrobacterium salinitolerans]